MAENLTKQEAEPLLSSLRWTADSDIINHEGEHVWLKPHHDEAGKRIGITDCCLVAAPCEKHANMSAKKGN